MKYAQLYENGTFSADIPSLTPIVWDSNNFCTVEALVKDGKADQFHIVPITPIDPPEYDPVIELVERDGAVNVDGQWQHQWKIVELFSTQAEKDAAIAAYIEAKRKASVPVSVTRRQAKQALLFNDLLANVQPAIDAIPDAAQRAMIQIEWDDSQEFERDRPALIALGSALGLTGVQLDSLFIEAVQL